MVGAIYTFLITTIIIPLAAQAHVAFYHPSMYGFNVTDKDFPYDNRPMTPLAEYEFEKWWAHNHINHPPHPGDYFELAAGKVSTAELACHKGATTWWESSEGGDIRSGNDPCPGPNSNDPNRLHTTGLDNVKGCALAIGPSHVSDIRQLQPDDMTVFSVNQTCVWNRFTDFAVPESMPACTGPGGHCICAWFWIHSPQSGGEQIFMNAFHCRVTPGSNPKALQKPQLARRCGDDPELGRPADPKNCTQGAQQPLYWLQKERNNMFEDYYTPPYYNDLYGFADGAQKKIFVEGGSAPKAPPPSSNAPVGSSPASSSSPITSSPGSGSAAGVNPSVNARVCSSNRSRRRKRALAKQPSALGASSLVKKSLWRRTVGW